MAAQSSEINSSSSYIPIDEEAVFTIRKLLWKHDKLCCFVNKRLPCFFTLLKSPLPWDANEYIPHYCKLSLLFDSKPEVFLAETLKAQEKHDNKHIAYCINKIFEKFKTSEYKTFIQNEGLVAQETFSELIDALSLPIVGYDRAFLDEPLPQCSSQSQASLSMYELLAHFQHARKRENKNLAESLAEKIFSRLRPGVSVDPIFEKCFYESLYSKNVGKEELDRRLKNDPSLASSSSSSWSCKEVPPHAVSYLTQLPSGSCQAICIEDKALTLIRYLRTALDNNPPNSSVLNGILTELEKDFFLTQAVQILGDSIVEEARATLLAIQLSLS